MGKGQFAPIDSFPSLQQQIRSPKFRAKAKKREQRDRRIGRNILDFRRKEKRVFDVRAIF
jgi:hypothetical protein